MKGLPVVILCSTEKTEYKSFIKYDEIFVLCKEYRLNKNAVSRIEGGHLYYRMPPYLNICNIKKNHFLT